MSRVRNNQLFFNKLLRELPTFFRIQRTMLLKRKRGRKPRRNLLPLRIKAAFYGSQFGDNIQLEASYKPFMDGTGKCGKGPSLLEKQDKATREQISNELGSSKRTSSACHQRRSLRCRPYICFEFQDQDAHVSPNPYDRHNASSY